MLRISIQTSAGLMERGMTTFYFVKLLMRMGCIHIISDNAIMFADTRCGLAILEESC